MPSPAEIGHQEKEEDEEREEDTEGHRQLSKEAIHHQPFPGSQVTEGTSPGQPRTDASSHRGHQPWPAKDSEKTTLALLHSLIE